MPGIATHFKILDLTISQLETSGNADLVAIANVMKNNSAYAYLGAIGPAIADFIPSDPPPEGVGSIGYGNSFKQIWQGAFKIVGGDGTDADPGLLKILETFQNFFDKIQPILDNEDLLALSDMKDNGDIDDITEMATALSNAVIALTAPTGYVTDITGYIGSGMKPAVNVLPGTPIANPDAWSARDFLFWRKSGQFTNQLLRDAENSNDDRFLAYAYGYVSSYASNIAGSSFINSIIGGTYRSDWWRYRWVNNFVDAWVYGYYETGASITGDVPNPAYDNWKSLCNSQLQSKIELPGIDPEDLLLKINTQQPFPQVLPLDFDTYWYAAFEKVYGPRTPMVSRFKPNSLNGAYLMTWMMLWFQTSGRVVGCNTAPPLTPPEGAGVAPSWVDPAVPGENGTGNVPPEPSVEDDVDEGKIITGILLALFGLAIFGAGGFIQGGYAVKAGVDLVLIGANEINWTKLRGDVYWYRMYLYNGLKALHEIMVLGALQHPYASVLESGDSVTLLGFPFTFDSAIKNCKSDTHRKFPPVPWDGQVGLAGLWISSPSRATEEPASIPYLSGEKYPNFFIDDNLNNPLSNGDIKKEIPLFTHADGADVRYNFNNAGDKIHVQFGNVVSNNVDLYVNQKFPDWNLDSDRGLAYLDWKFKNVYSNPVDIEPI